jgi:hypothetical protein
MTDQAAYEGRDLATYKRMFEDFQSQTADARKESQIDGDYYHGVQWTPEERRSLASRKQPDIAFNRIRPAINGTIGVIKQGSTDPKAYPRNPQDEQVADVASKTLRYAADKANFDAVKIDVATDFLIEGTGAVLVGVDAELQITTEQVRWEEFFYDPRSRRQDFKDASYMGVAKWMFADDVIPLADGDPVKVKAIEAAANGEALGIDATFQDRPNDGSATAWMDPRKRRLMVVELYHREGGQWFRCLFHAGGKLQFGPSPYVDEKGRPCCPIEAQSCYVDRENNRYGVVRDMRGPQDEINKRRSKLLHLVSVRQVQEAQPGMGMGEVDAVRAEAARPDGVIPSGWMVVNTNDMAQGQAQLLAESKAEIERMGQNPAILGRQNADTSGRAQLVRQQAGLTEFAVIFGGIEEWELRVYRQMWARARQFWTAPMWIRVTDDQGAPQFVGLNQPQMGAAMDPYTGQPVQVQTGTENAVAEMDVDIILDTIPDTANVQQEQFAMMVELAKVGALGPNPGPLLLEASSLPNKRQVVEKLQSPPDPQAQAMQQAQQELAMRGAEAEIAGKEASAFKTMADAKVSLAKVGQVEADTAVKSTQAVGNVHHVMSPQPAAGV